MSAGAFDAQPAYRVFADLASRHIGATELISAYFSLGDLDLVGDLMRRAGLELTVARTEQGTVRFSSVEQFVRGEIDGSPLAHRPIVVVEGALHVRSAAS